MLEKARRADTFIVYYVQLNQPEPGTGDILECHPFRVKTISLKIQFYKYANPLGLIEYIEFRAFYLVPYTFNLVRTLSSDEVLPRLLYEYWLEPVKI
jgi:hypothetical protein